MSRTRVEGHDTSARVAARARRVTLLAQLGPLRRSAVCSLLWSCYGYLEGDVYIWGPNAVGLVFAVFQGLLFLCFGCPRRAPPENPEDSLPGYPLSLEAP